VAQLTDWDLTARGTALDGTVDERTIENVELGDWRDNDQLKDFSGEATYRTTVAVNSAQLRGAPIFLAVQQFHDAILVRVNGRKAGSAVTYPAALQIEHVLRPGQNEIEITVVNSLTNRLLTGGIQSPPGFPETAPMASGLVGPVVLKSARN
jgi:(4-O-methyl)-D-glucuronate---lignin esterase